jgi:membrane dipeptidase
VAAKGGAVCVSTIYLAPMNLTEERAKLFAQYEKIAGLPPAGQADLARRWRDLDRAGHIWQGAGFELYMKALLHVIRVAGVDHVCFGADWDGGGGLADMEGIEALPRITERLKAEGYSAADIEKMWSGNVLRILEQAERAAARGRRNR